MASSALWKLNNDSREGERCALSQLFEVRQGLGESAIFVAGLSTVIYAH